MCIDDDNFDSIDFQKSSQSNQQLRKYSNVDLSTFTMQ